MLEETAGSLFHARIQFNNIDRRLRSLTPRAARPICFLFVEDEFWLLRAIILELVYDKVRAVALLALFPNLATLGSLGAVRRLP